MPDGAQQARRHLSGQCYYDRCGKCTEQECTHRCHEKQEWDFVYGWQVRESYDGGTDG